MKKNYNTPATSLIEIKTEACLLSASPGEANIFTDEGTAVSPESSLTIKKERKSIWD